MKILHKKLKKMTRIRLHFYRWTRFFSKLIQWRTFSEFSHVAIEMNGFIYESKEWKWVIKTKPRNTPPTSLKKTLTYDIPPEKAQKVLEYLENQLWRGYDYLWLLSFFWIPKRKKNNKKLWCSEYIEQATYLCGITAKTSFPVSPWSLFLLCK